MFQNLVNVAKAVCAKVYNTALKASDSVKAAVAGGSALVLAEISKAQVVLPDTGIELGDYIEAMFTDFAGYFSLLVGFMVGYFAIWMGIKLIKKLGGKSA